MRTISRTAVVATALAVPAAGLAPVPADAAPCYRYKTIRVLVPQYEMQGSRPIQRGSFGGEFLNCVGAWYNGVWYLKRYGTLRYIREFDVRQI